MTPEAKARQQIDQKLILAGWQVQDFKQINLGAALGVAVREYPTDTGPADYVLFVNRKAVGVIEAKPDATILTFVEGQTERYANSALKWRVEATPLPFLFESTGLITKFTDGRDPAPRSREIFHFFRPETLREWNDQAKTLRRRLVEDIPELPTRNLRDCQIVAVTGLEQSFTLNKPRVDPNGNRRWQNVHGHHRRVSFAEIRRRKTHSVSGGHAQPRQTGAAGIPGVHAAR